ncbi:MAG TPA: xanthine dehydrogenase family protein subunit M [Acetobacteraceae bacterium]|jgi:xanthine dehydrogenase YagS FAD-binding subunit
MQAFHLAQPTALLDALVVANASDTKFIAGGTDLMQLLKENVETPTQLVDLERVGLSKIGADAGGLRIEAMARMSDVAAHPDVRAHWPVIAQALEASASPQVRNMGTIGGNLLQRTRCGYFRDTGFNCNKREPGSGCPAIAGENRMLAILGGSDHCIATHASDLAVALTALDAMLELRRAGGAQREVPITEFYRLPADTPHIETVLQAGELITAVIVPASAAARNSHYLKLRDRASFEFALVSAAVALETASGAVRDIRVAAGGVGTRPWRLPEVEAALRGKQLNDDALREASSRAGEGARPATQNGFKQVLLRRAVLRALQTASA